MNIGQFVVYNDGRAFFTNRNKENNLIDNTTI